MPENDREVTPEQLDGLVAVLDLVRSGEARTRPELARRSGFGRTVVTQRLGHLLASGLVEEGALGPSTGGRAPRELRFRAGAGAVLVAELGATTMTVGVSDLAGELLDHRDLDWDIAAGPDATLPQVERLFDELLAANPALPMVWGVGVGIPGPVEFASGRPVAPPIMPGWDGHPVRDRLAARFAAPVWVDNDVNIMARGEVRSGLARAVQDVIYVKIGTGIGAGLVSRGALHRGAQGCAGDIGHISLGGAVPRAAQVICRCGNTGCLEALAGGRALARDATEAAEANPGGVLASLLSETVALTGSDVVRAAEFGDPDAVELLQRAGTLVGETLAALVNFYNPATILLGGSVGASSDLMLASIRQAIYRRSLPLATRELRIVRSPSSGRAGLRGAAFMVVDELFSRERLGDWIADGAPVGARTVAFSS